MLTAIPVGQGDAFLLQREGGPRILVDGGRSRIALPGQVARIGTTTINVIACTHADADHAQGLVGLLDSGEIPVNEVWLPGRWTSRLADLLRGDPGWFRELAEDIAKTDRPTLESIGEEEDGAGDDAKVGVQDLAEVLEAEDTSAGSSVLPVDESEWLDFLPIMPYWPFAPRSQKQKLWIDAIKTAARIRNVALAAHHHGAKIRWFDFDEAKQNGPSGGEPFLRPVNSHELTPGHAVRKLRMLRFLALSVANRESLVFAAPEQDGVSGVVFTADSDMVCSQYLPKFTRPVVVTAPHHGSESNSAAYAAVSAALGTTTKTWVRSDGNCSKRPGATFLALQAPRACTLCRNGGAPKQAVVLDDTSNGWTLRGSPCRCK